jgi:hypothetical protein
MRSRSLKIAPAVRVKMQLTTRHILAGCALLAILIAMGVFLFLNLGNSHDTLAATSKPLIVSRASGNWNASSTWLRNNIPSVPQDGDSIVIKSGHLISMGSHVTINNVWLRVFGTLWIDNGIKLWTNRTSFIEVMAPNGIINGDNGGTKIVMDNRDVWNASLGPVNSYSTISYNEGVQHYTTLPVELVEFKARLQDQKILLEWSTAAEINNEYFTLERSKDGRNYQTVAVVAGAGNTRELSRYNFSDRTPLPGLSYYRLKQTDYDGASRYSKPLSVSNAQPIAKPSPASGMGSGNAENAVGLHVVAMGPNPFEKSFFADFDLSSAGLLTIQLMDMQGKIFETKTIEGVIGNNRYEFNDEYGLQPGTYLFSVKQQMGGSKMMRLVKR